MVERMMRVERVVLPYRGWLGDKHICFHFVDSNEKYLAVDAPSDECSRFYHNILRSRMQGP